VKHRGKLFCMVYADLSSWVERFWANPWGHKKGDYYAASCLKHNCDFAVMLFLNTLGITMYMSIFMML